MLIRRYLAIAALTLVAGAAPAQKQNDVIVKGKRLDDDIIVEGSRKTLAPGMWSIQSGPGIVMTTISGGDPEGNQRRRRTAIPVFRWNVCLPGKALAAQVAKLLIEGSEVGCSPIRFRQRGHRVIADFSCAHGALDENVDYSGTATSGSVDLQLNVDSQFSRGGMDISTETQSRLIANRLAECTTSGAAQPLTIRNPVFAASVHQKPLEDDLTPAPEVMPRGVGIGDPAQPDDIVVLARKLMNLRLRYASDGRILNNCSNTGPSGDARIDRIGCEVLKACVASGSEANDTTLACFNTRIMSLVPGVRAAPAAAYRGKRAYIER